MTTLHTKTRVGLALTNVNLELGNGDGWVRALNAAD